ncbi:auxin-responsive protein IAA12-like [Bidens hawaiensis]|uniref:auxin-responsive protein IAA12-like n=1 Tax=Bidens hawaiensis TaxID=980011 RepID=UPI004049EF06
MDVTLGLLDQLPSSDGGGGVPSGGSTTMRSILTGSKSKEDNNKNTMVVSTEVTSSYPAVVDDESLDGLELGLGLSIGGGGLKSKTAVTGGWSQYARILTAKDFPTTLVSEPNNSCSSSSSVNIPNSSASGTKRTATDSVSPPNGTSVVGWPPVSKAHRMPNLANQMKSPTENFISKSEQNKSKNRTVGIKDYSDERNGTANKKYRSVKVNMDGTLIGRKVDLNAHTSYEMLAQTLHEMFFSKWPSKEAVKPSRLLDGTSEFVLTYEDKDGDWMLVGDVPWEMFISSVKRLRIMKNSESNELASRCEENSERYRD